MKVDPVPGITAVSVASVDQTARELAGLVGESGAREVAEIAHQSSASLVAVVRHAAADPALLFGVLMSTAAPLAVAELEPYLADADIREVVHGRSRRGYPVVLAERVVTVAQLRAGEPFDCQLQAVIADPARARIAVFTLSSPSGRGWLELSAVFGHLIASVDFDG